MKSKVFIFCLLLCGTISYGFGQRIVVDTASTNKYLITPQAKQETAKPAPEPSFGDRAMSIGMGILGRLKARLNLEEAAESLKEKREKILGKDGEEKKENDG